MKQKRFVVMLPVELKEALRVRAAKMGVSMRVIVIRALRQFLGLEG